MGQKLARESISSADVVLVGYREQKLERLGLSYQQVCAIAPRTLYCHISGWGPSGPDSQVAATELQVQAVAGMHRYLGRDGEAPVRIGFDLASTATALAAAQGILAGLLWRLDSGVGQRIDVSMLASAIAINQWSTVAESAPDSIVGRQLKGQDWPRDHGFASREGPCLIGFRQPGVWQRFVVVIGRVDLLVDPVFLNAINTHPPLFAHKVESTLCTWSMESLDKLVRGELGGTLVPVLNLKSLLDHEQVRNLSIVNHSTVLKVSLPLDTTANLLVKAQHE